mgnify:CR=1 FL=1
MFLFKYIISPLLYYFISSDCPNIVLQTDPPLNITEYIRKSWYIQEQQVNGYQSKNDLFCVTATYNIDKHSKVPYFNGKVISVYNYANKDKVNGLNPNNATILCAREINNLESEKLIVAPCILPNLLGGDYWVVSAGPKPNNYEWAIVSGGQPKVRVDDKTCTTKQTGINGAGLWLFSRKKNMDEKTIQMLKHILISKGISTKYLLKVEHNNCTYNGAFIK